MAARACDEASGAAAAFETNWTVHAGYFTSLDDTRKRSLTIVRCLLSRDGNDTSEIVRAHSLLESWRNHSGYGRRNKKSVGVDDPEQEPAAVAAAARKKKLKATKTTEGERPTGPPPLWKRQRVAMGKV
jgi:hypothetical protein